jgi:hypothetical protein
MLVITAQSGSKATVVAESAWAVRAAVAVGAGPVGSSAVGMGAMWAAVVAVAALSTAEGCSSSAAPAGEEQGEAAERLSMERQGGALGEAVERLSMDREGVALSEGTGELDGGVEVLGRSCEGSELAGGWGARCDSSQSRRCCNLGMTPRERQCCRIASALSSPSRKVRQAESCSRSGRNWGSKGSSGICCNCERQCQAKCV